jgi:membrane dipeptidase
MTYWIDAHEDIACNVLEFGRDLTLSTMETRKREVGTPYPALNGEALVGLPEYRQGQLALIFSTLFASPKEYRKADWETQVFSSPDEANKIHHQQIDVYQRLEEENFLDFQRIFNRAGLKKLITPWQGLLAGTPWTLPPIGLITLMEGADCIRTPDDLDEFWELGVRIIGPTWAGNRFCGGTRVPGPLTKEGRALLAGMGERGFILDVSHMSEEPMLQALDLYTGGIVATHANCKALLDPVPYQRHLTDQAIRKLVERGAVIGVVPFNRFLKADWKDGDPKSDVPLSKLVDHMDYICQLAGDAEHVGIGTDFDGGFGMQSTPEEIDTVADIQKLEGLLSNRGYNQKHIEAVFHSNWLHFLERTLPE